LPPEAELLLAPEAELLLAPEVELLLAPEAELLLAPEAELLLAPEVELLLAPEAELLLAPEAPLTCSCTPPQRSGWSGRCTSCRPQDMWGAGAAARRQCTPANTAGESSSNPLTRANQQFSRVTSACS
jgi:hypothetical protein